MSATQSSSEPSDERFLLKALFNRESVRSIGAAVVAARPGFDLGGFLEKVFDARWPERELKQRIRHLASVLHDVLPGGYRDQLQVLLDAVPHAPRGFQSIVFSDFVEVYGVQDWEASIPALAQFTRLESAEFAVRPFLVSQQVRTIATMLEWAADPDPAVRRLASEGSRPRLPWGMRLHHLVADPAPILPILERLRDDPDEVVRRSVANNLNDISKDHPDIVIDLLRRWDPQPGTPLYRLARHALRTLLKAGHPDALRILGFDHRPPVALERLDLTPVAPSIGRGATLRFTVASRAGEPLPVIPGYAIHYVKADGSRSRKVFRLRSVVMEPGGSASFSRNLSFRQMTTRLHRPGRHKLEVLVNGSEVGALEFDLLSEY